MATSVTTFHTPLSWPRDATRLTPHPCGEVVRVRATQPFQLTCGPLVLLSEEVDPSGHWCVTLDTPEVTSPTLVALEIVTELDNGTLPVLLLPDAEQLPIPAHNITGAYGVLSHPGGAAALARAAWGTVRSQYDALLAWNPSRTGPSDRRVVLPRMRQWLRFAHGLNLPVDAAAVVDFCVLSRSTMRWRFQLEEIRWSINATLGDNAVTFSLEREGPASPDAIILLRPDLDDRTFHSVTKAYEGAEQRFPGAVQGVSQEGFQFRLQHGAELTFSAQGATFQAGTEWCYMVPLPFDAERGLATSMDVFSAGEFHWHPATQVKATLHAAISTPDQAAAAAAASICTVAEPTVWPLPSAMQRALDLYLVQRDAEWTVIAGYPWFLDWGRDSLIFVRGLLADGRLEQACSIIRRFAAWEEAGSLPNMVCGADASDRETSDAPLLLVLAIRDAAALDPTVLEQTAGSRTLRQIVLDLVTAHFQDSTHHGVRCDHASGLLYSPSHFTWMDTQNPAGSPRQGYAIDIQALWFAALTFAQQLAPTHGFGEKAAQVASSVAQYFWQPDRGYLSDCLHSPHFAPASEALADDHLRPAQLQAISLGLITDETIQQAVLSACHVLLVPGALRTLAPQPVVHPITIAWSSPVQHDPLQPYHGQYTGPEDSHRKPAYHNGTAWPWQMPSYVEALLQVLGPEVLPQARKLMSATVWLMRSGCIGQLPEILDGDSPHRPRGCGAQAWSISEWLRVWKKLTGK